MCADRRDVPPVKQWRVSALSLLLFILSSSRDGGSAGTLVSWLSSRFSFFREVKLCMTRSKNRDMKETKWMLVSQIHNFPSWLAKQDIVTEFTEINQRGEFKIRASPPCHLSCRIFSKATLCGSPVKAAVVAVCQVKAVDWVFRSVPRASPSVLCHYWDVWRKKWRKKIFL